MRKEGTDIDKERRTSSFSFSERNLELEINTLLIYLHRSPKIVQKQFSPLLHELKKDLPNHTKLSLYLDYLYPNQQRYQLIDGSIDLVHNILKSYQLRTLFQYYSRVSDKIEAQFSKPVHRKKQEIFTERQNFGSIQLIYPDYDSYYKMSKQQKSHLAQHHPKHKQKEFFVEPRFVVRLQQFAHFRNNDLHKGDVIYMQYEGNTITGNKAYLVANQRALQLWLAESNNYPIPVLTIPTQEELQKKKEEQAKKQKEKVQESVPTPVKLEFSHKFLGHTQKITSISLSQDQYYAISGSVDKTIRLWCLRLKICLAIYRGHTKTIWDVCFSPSGYYFLSGSNDGLMMLWKTDEPHAQRVYNHRADIYKVSFAKDPSFVISAGQDATIKIWKTLEAQLIKEIRLCQPILTFNLGFSGAYMATVQNDGRVSVLDLLRGTTINSFYFQAPDRKKTEEKQDRNKILKMHDVCLSQDERQLSCISSNYVLIYNMDKLQKKITNNIFTLYKQNREEEKVLVLQPKEVLYLGGDTNLTHCSYQSRNVLVVCGQFKY